MARKETSRPYSSLLSYKRQYDDELPLPKKQHIITERIIPINHQHATIIHDEKQEVESNKEDNSLLLELIVFD